MFERKYKPMSKERALRALKSQSNEGILTGSMWGALVIGGVLVLFVPYAWVGLVLILAVLGISLRGSFTRILYEDRITRQLRREGFRVGNLVWMPKGPIDVVVEVTAVPKKSQQGREVVWIYYPMSEHGGDLDRRRFREEKP